MRLCSALGRASLLGRWIDLTGEHIPIHLRTGANNLVTTAGRTHLPEQPETIHVIKMLRKEASSGVIDDLGHVWAAFGGCGGVGRG